jgi:hypothetical protein
MPNEDNLPVEATSELNDLLGSGWAETPNGHVVPINDLCAHIENPGCWCKPTNDGGGVIVHHSRDGRELFESDYRPEFDRRTADVWS